MIKKSKNTVPWTYFINDLNGEEVAETFYRQELQKAKHKEFSMEKVFKKKVIYYMLNGIAMLVLLIAGLRKNT